MNPPVPSALTVLHVADMSVGGGAEIMFQATLAASRDLGFTTIPHVAERAPGPIGYVFSLREARRLLRLLREVEPHVVHFQNYYHRLTPSVLWAVRRYRRRAGVKISVVFTAHDYHLACPNSVMQYFTQGEMRNVPADERPVRLARRYDRRSIAHSLLKTAQWTLAYRLLHLERELDVVIAPSDFVGSRLRGRSPARVTVVRNVIDIAGLATERGHATNSTDHDLSTPIHLAYVGRLESDKGADTLLDTFASLPRGRYRLDFFGDGSLRQALECRAGMHDWGSEVTFHGWVDPDRVWKDAAGADVVVVPSMCYETASLSMLEAAAVGIPTLGNRIGALIESSALSKVSDVCDITDADAVEAALEGLRGQRGANALRDPLEYTPEAYRNALAGVYADAIAAGRTQNSA